MDKKKKNQDVDKDAQQQYMDDFGIEYMDENGQYQFYRYWN